ncbi:hypothetical protein BZA05DRAFT_418020 [Tricharina praecox]|uniref:uncharacterized protein n=1 Tax=Tricharina praecox TaxID=43433 RepID=UPI00221FBA31|nr:uncharacterized protein BZA05DRAFT_418020 [Tricharina praecox]KAI5853961.1 hypothetical protein BZA05DRAFT_418020 [Tricharina praecox]
MFSSAFFPAVSVVQAEKLGVAMAVRTGGRCIYNVAPGAEFLSPRKALVICNSHLARARARVRVSHQRRIFEPDVLEPTGLPASRSTGPSFVHSSRLVPILVLIDQRSARTMDMCIVAYVPYGTEGEGEG